MSVAYQKEIELHLKKNLLKSFRIRVMTKPVMNLNYHLLLGSVEVSEIEGFQMLKETILKKRLP